MVRLSAGLICLRPNALTTNLMRSFVFYQLMGVDLEWRFKMSYFYRIALRIGLCVAALIALGVFVGVKPALADGMTIWPGAGTYATSYAIQTWGFAANEPVAIAAFPQNGTGAGLLLGAELFESD
jgi:hypothetical protein